MHASLPAADAGIADPALDLTIRGFSFRLATDAQGRLGLTAAHQPGFAPVVADWNSADQRRRIAEGRKQLLARAVGLTKHEGEQPLRVLDCTAGLGRDAYTLASLGAEVTALERNPVLAALQRDAHRRAPDPLAAARLRLVEADAAQFMAEASRQQQRWDCVLLDPMYPDDGKRALPSKEMQLFRDLTGGDPDADALLSWARTVAGKRVAVKRPAKAPPLAGLKPHSQLLGSQARFDLYTPV